MPNSLVAIDAESGVVVSATQVGQRPGPVEVGDGAAWVVDLDDDTVSRVNLETREVKKIRVGVGTNDVTFGEGAVWVLNPTNLTVQRIDPEFSRVTDTIAVESDGRTTADQARSPPEREQSGLSLRSASTGSTRLF